ncbi:MAG: 16S rRNA (cytosine(967)-C(5))-methyltransferase RsmB [Chthoniobacteraceae bacterium]
MAATARSTAHRLLVDWERTRPHADDLLHERLAASRLDARDRALVTELFYGVLRNLSTLDFLIARLRDGEIDADTRAVLRLGLQQLFHTRIAVFAAVKETVSLSRRAGGLVNAILRRADRERDTLLAALAAAPDSVRWSHPDFLLEKWTSNFGPDATRALAEWNNTPAPVILRANTLKTTRDELLAALPGAEPHPFHPLALRTPRIPDDWLADGLCYVQDPSTLAACDLLAPQPGDIVLDACAAPGGKTTCLAALMRNEGRIIACDMWESRVARLRENCERLGVRNTTALVLDTMKESPELQPRSFDRILVDAPCSNTGVIRRRVDVRWRLSEEDFLRMPAQQLALLRRCAGLLKPGGTLVYSTCSLEPEENELVADEAARTIPGLRLHTTRHIRPWLDGVDGAYCAQFVAA